MDGQTQAGAGARAKGQGKDETKLLGGQRAGLLKGKGSDSSAPKAWVQLWEGLSTHPANIQN